MQQSSGRGVCDIDGPDPLIVGNVVVVECLVVLALQLMRVVNARGQQCLTQYEIANLNPQLVTDVTALGGRLVSGVRTVAMIKQRSTCLKC